MDYNGWHVNTYLNREAVSRERSVGGSYTRPVCEEALYGNEEIIAIKLGTSLFYSHWPEKKTSLRSYFRKRTHMDTYNFTVRRLHYDMQYNP